MNSSEVNAASAAGELAVDLRQVIYALSDALDLVGIDDVAHGKRVGVMAAACARELGLDASAVGFLFDLGLLHDIGVSNTTTHHHLVSEFDWDSAQGHCEIGQARLQGFAPLAAMAQPILYHHTRWDVLSRLAGVPSTVAEQANLIYLVDRVDALAAPFYAGGTVLLEAGKIRERIAGLAGSYFAPQLVEGFMRASNSEAFWLQLEPRGIQAVLLDMLGQQAPVQATYGQLRQLAEIFSQIVDAKSPFTASHSLGVARLARWLGERCGLAEVRCDKLEIAGLLHDLGKLRIPDEILDKPGALDGDERKMMNAHSFETFQVLRRISGFEDIAWWAACHHEEPDGTGYPFRVEGATLPVEARILRVADIFQAMAQDRPYRAGLSAAALRSFMERLVGEGRVDRELVACVVGDIDAALLAARPDR